MKQAASGLGFYILSTIYVVLTLAVRFGSSSTMMTLSIVLLSQTERTQTLFFDEFQHFLCGEFII